MTFSLSLVVTAIVAILIVLVEHYLPWNLLLLKPRPGRIASYIMGVMAFAIPLTLLFSLVDLTRVQVVISLWVVITASGLGTLAGYGLDNWLDHRNRANEAEERENAVLGQLP